MKTKTVRVLLADDHPAIRAGIKGELDQVKSITIVGEASTGQEALQLTDELNPDLLLLDMALPDMDGVKIIKQLQLTHPQVKVLVFSGYASDAFVFGALQAGALGYLLKDEPLERLAEAIRVAMHGKVILSHKVAQKMTWQTTREQTTLTTREWEVLTRLVAGMNTCQIADELDVTAKTIGNHVSNVLNKLGLTSRTELVAHALREEMVHPIQR